MAWWVEVAGRDGAQGCSALLNPAHQGDPGAGASLVKTPHNSALCVTKGSFIPLLAVTPVRTASLFSSLPSGESSVRGAAWLAQGCCRGSLGVGKGARQAWCSCPAWPKLWLWVHLLPNWLSRILENSCGE